MQTWAAVPSWLRDEAVRDLNVDGQVQPTLVAFQGDRPTLLALCRPSQPDDALQVLTELLALAMLFDGDRVAVSFGGRARSLDALGGSAALSTDQQIVLVAVADACGPQVTVDCTATPVTHTRHRRASTSGGGELVATEPLATGEANGWLPRMLAVALERRAEVRCDLDELAHQAARCLALGHELYLPGEPPDPR